MSQKLTQLEKDLHEKFCFHGFNLNKIKRKLLEMIIEIEELGIYKKVGCYSINEYGRKFGGLSEFSIDQARRVYKKKKEVPELGNVIQDIGINKAEMVARVATKENVSFLVEESKKMNVSELREYVGKVQDVQKIGCSDLNMVEAVAIEKSLKIELDSEMQKAFFRLKKKMKLDMSNKWVLKSILRKMEDFMGTVFKELDEEGDEDFNDFCDSKFGGFNISGSVHGDKYDVISAEKFKKTSRYIPKKIQNKVLKRSGGTCEYENCVHAVDHYHHLDRFSITKSHENVFGLCKVHHGLVHSGVVVCEKLGPKGWRLMLKDLSYLIPESIQKIDEKRREIIRNYAEGRVGP